MGALVDIISVGVTQTAAFKFLLTFIIQISRMQCTHFLKVLTLMCLYWSIDGPVDGAVHEALIKITHTSSGPVDILYMMLIDKQYWIKGCFKLDQGRGFGIP